jgi:hypothetical protein
VDEPAVLLPLDPLHSNLGVDLGAVVVRVGQVVHERRVLGAVVAAADAVAAEMARLLVHADVVDPVLEGHVDGRAVELGAEVGGGDLHGLELLQRRQLLRVRHRLQHLLGAVVAVLERRRIRTQLLRPARVLEHARLGPQGDVRVDERGPAQPAALEDVHVPVGPEVEETGRGPEAAFLVVDLELAHRLGRRVRILARLELLPALEKADAAPGPGHARGGDGAAVPRADDDHVVARLQVLDRRGEAHADLGPARGRGGALQVGTTHRPTKLPSEP